MPVSSGTSCTRNVIRQNGEKERKMTKPNFKITELKGKLKDTSHDELISMIVDCYKLNDQVKEYFYLKYEPEEAMKEIYDKCKKEITHEFFPERGFGELKLARAKKAISYFNNLCDDKMKTIDLMIYYVEMGVQFTNTYGDINETFYNSMLSMYDKVTQQIIKEQNNETYQFFRSRLCSIVEETDGIGWGFHDDLVYMYSNIEEDFENLEFES
jgi:hypothetical protein